MKGESREAKGHKSIGDGRTWYGKRETLMPLSPVSLAHSLTCKSSWY